MSEPHIVPARGFPTEEFETRVANAQRLMDSARLDALVLTGPQNFRYFSGFNSQFWESPTRPFFLVVGREHDPIAVIPEIGGPGMATTWVSDIRTWPAPRPDDDGVTLLADVLASCPRRYGRAGWEMGRESVVRMPITDFDRLRNSNLGIEFVDGSPLIWELRKIKSQREVEKIREACRIGSDAFDLFQSRIHFGDSEIDASREFRIAALECGADTTPFVAVCSGPGGYSQIIVGPQDARLTDGVIMFIDTGITYDGYFCDFDRNFAFGHITEEAQRCHEAVWDATEAGIAAARPGVTAAGLWTAQAHVLDAAGAQGLNVGRSGHGLGMHLTEPPSNMPGDDTVLEPGMVMTIEPGMELAPGKMLVHEENIVITEDGCELLSRRAPRIMPVITN
ncbi:MAG: Xaa-Pro peptidase family protein [Gammaproteobacteria bacterium]|nr:Xaa-Pro peptidase family protein [Gammaproteobacteria bacterium]MDH3465675.1 Xaa-Pro peptidase family protein [Gammaproteobacteria bacterium]